MKRKKITIRDVANKLDVSISTVSRALNDHHCISANTKDKVRKVADELNYSPNYVAASLRSGKGNSIGVIIPQINNSFISNCIFGIESVTYPAGFNLVICQSNENYKKEVKNVKALMESQVSGIIMSLSSETVKINHLKNIINYNIPLVMFDRVSDTLDAHAVVNDDFKITTQAIEHFHNNNYRKIAIICGPTHIYGYRNRMEGYLEALKNLNLKNRANWIIKGIETKQEAKFATEKLFKGKCLPDAIFCTSDNLALGVIETLKELKIKIPQEVGVIGYRNDMFSEILQPTLTSIEQYPQDIGAHAATIMLDILQNENKKSMIKKAHKKIYVQAKLIIRESSNP